MNRHKFDGVDPVVLYPLNMFVSLYLAAEPVVLVVMYINLRYFLCCIYEREARGPCQCTRIQIKWSGFELWLGKLHCVPWRDT